ncbi:phosphatidic acid phosphatase type [Ptychographa xylographoides]|nr:phosphatidic acid phosphatase type [Ptychographa xylographoides]
MPTLGAALIAISRIMDARHHPFDVITGSLLGTLTAFCAYRQYFPPVSEAWRKGQAYPIRSWGTEPMGPSAMNAEREMARDQGIEPLRTVPFHVDEEQNTTPRAGGLPLSHDPYADPVSDQNDSVNQQASGQPYDRQSPHHSTSSSPHELQNPFSSTSVTRGRPIDGGENWYSLDDDNDEGGYELQPRSMLSDSHLGLDQADTAYKPQSYTAYTQGPPTHRDIGPETIKPPTGDLGIP